jgi:NADH-quinone oxidoreductase subunit G
MEGDHRQPPSPLIPRFWEPGWNSVQSLNKFQEEVGGPLRGGDPGIRLIEPHPQIEAAWFEDIPARGQPEDSQWLFVPLHHIFGSEELSVLSPGIVKLCPKPYVALHPQDALALGMAEGDMARVGDSVLDLPVRILPSLPRKVAGLPVGLPGAPVLDLPASGMVSKGEGDG